MRKEYYKEFTKPEEPEKRKEKRKEGKERERGRKERARERERGREEWGKFELWGQWTPKIPLPLGGSGCARQCWTLPGFWVDLGRGTEPSIAFLLWLLSKRWHFKAINRAYSPLFLFPPERYQMPLTLTLSPVFLSPAEFPLALLSRFLFS